jgi:antirestriction protein ArdC
MKADDVMAAVVEDIIAAMEAGVDTWQMPWRTSFTMPYNATTGVSYRGGNVLACWITGAHRAYSTQQWATYKQWASIGQQVAKGQRGLHLVKWSPIEREQPNGTIKKMMIPNGFVVFNAAQLEHAGEPDYEFDVSHLPPNEAEMWLDLFMVPFTMADGAPSYNWRADRVNMPVVDAFDTSCDYLSTLAHELAHWTGHESRLGRDMTGRFGSDSYAMEELVAELSAAFTCARYHVTPADRHDHAAYLDHWVRVLRADPKVLWTIASKAQAATDHLRTYVTSASEPAVA